MDSRFGKTKTALALNSRPAFGFISTADPIPLPELKPGAMREHFVVPSIGGRDVACVEWPDIGRFEHFLQLLDIVDDAFNVHRHNHLGESAQRSTRSSY